jgi:transcriptional antiterminator Rof (Rho-off)
MTIENMFETALRNKFRFQFKGLISVEDLYDLSVQNLDTVFKGLNSQLKQVQEESLLNTKTKEDKELDVKIEIVKHIVKVKLEEENSRLKAKAQKEQKQKIMEILSVKQDESLQNKSVDELKAMLEELNS